MPSRISPIRPVRAASRAGLLCGFAGAASGASRRVAGATFERAPHFGGVEKPLAANANKGNSMPGDEVIDCPRCHADGSGDGVDADTLAENCRSHAVVFGAVQCQASDVLDTLNIFKNLPS
jgi:hypothetical protein